MGLIEDTVASLERIQKFDCDSLSREEELGQAFNFAGAIEPARRLIRLYKQMSTSVIEDFPDNHVTQIKKQADADFNRFQQILSFDPKEQTNTIAQRDTLIKQITDSYNGAFNTLYPYISYGVSKSVDFQRLENEARATIQSINDKAGELTAQLNKHQEDAQNVLEDVRKVAAEQGVSQQAIYFKEESENHEALAETWRMRMIWLAIALGFYAFISVFFHKIPWITPTNTFESVQLITSKILIFAVIAYMLFLSAKNFLSHKHNAVVNKHRQNALMTFSALADASSSDEAKDVVLNHAASCIFSPQETGYIKNENSSSNKSIVELMPKTMMKIAEKGI